MLQWVFLLERSLPIHDPKWAAPLMPTGTQQVSLPCRFLDLVLDCMNSFFVGCFHHLMWSPIQIMQRSWSLCTHGYVAKATNEQHHFYAFLSLHKFVTLFFLGYVWIIIIKDGPKILILGGANTVRTT